LVLGLLTGREEKETIAGPFIEPRRNTPTFLPVLVSRAVYGKEEEAEGEG
jgi:hypothetical protein